VAGYSSSARLWRSLIQDFVSSYRAFSEPYYAGGWLILNGTSLETWTTFGSVGAGFAASALIRPTIPRQVSLEQACGSNTATFTESWQRALVHIPAAGFDARQQFTERREVMLDLCDTDGPKDCISQINVRSRGSLIRFCPAEWGFFDVRDLYFHCFTSLNRNGPSNPRCRLSTILLT